MQPKTKAQYRKQIVTLCAELGLESRRYFDGHSGLSALRHSYNWLKIEQKARAGGYTTLK